MLSCTHDNMCHAYNSASVKKIKAQFLSLFPVATMRHGHLIHATMKPTIRFFIQRLSFGLVIACCSISMALAQTNTSPICEEGDCSPAVFSVQVEEPLKPEPAGDFNRQRTEHFKQAFNAFKQIKNNYAGSEDWQDKYDDSQLGGQSSLRHYQLEGQFAYEYVQNPDFKKFIDSNVPNAGNFVKDGFENSRKGLNLSTRMGNNCPDELKKLENKKGPTLPDLKMVYMKLGQELGYFDQQGNLLKPLDPPQSVNNQGTSKLSKKEKIAQMKTQVDQLPVGQEMKDKIGGIKNGLVAARPKLGLLKGALWLLNSRLATFLPGPLGLLAKINTVKNVLGALKGINFKLPFKGLLGKIGNLFKRGEDIGNRAGDLSDKSQKLKDKYDDISRQADDVQDKIEERTEAVDQLEKKLAELAQKKEELKAKLEDKPKKILEELEKQVSDLVKEAGDQAEKAEKESGLKDELLNRLEDITKAKDDVLGQLEQLEKTMEELTKEQEVLASDTKDVEQEVETAKKQEKMAEEMKDQFESLKPENELESEIDQCEDELKNLLLNMTGLDKKQDELNKKVEGMAALPGKLKDKLSNLNLFQNKLKLPKNGIPIADKAMAKVDDLMGKATALGSVVEILTGKKSRLQETIEGYDQKLDVIQETYQTRVADLDGLKNELFGLIAEKSGLKAQLEKVEGNAEALETVVQGFIKRYNIFDDKTDCNSQKALDKLIKELKKEQEETAPAQEELEEELQHADNDATQLEEQTQKVEQEIEQQVKAVEELKQEEKTIKEEYGADVQLEPVTPEQWAESFEVERPYWDAVFHPDDEVVEGQKGRYFEVRLKDADKNIKLLFGAGEYCLNKSDFRKKYGSTIGAFVTEALHGLKKNDQQKVKLFIQGSADIAGHKTFSGKLNEQFYYETISILPQKADPERFSNATIEKNIPAKNFRNDDLPDLRAQYLKEMISAYSKKFDPVVLQGTVKDFKDVGERNVVIYLFFPETLLAEYEKQ